MRPDLFRMWSAIKKKQVSTPSNIKKLGCNNTFFNPIAFRTLNDVMKFVCSRNTPTNRRDSHGEEHAEVRNVFNTEFDQTKGSLTRLQLRV
jgi:hypothetical protein